MKPENVIGPLVAWRLWVYDDATGLLKSVYKWQTVWQPLEELTATCPHYKGIFKRKLHDDKEVPVENCSCGIFSCATPQLLYAEYEEWRLHLQWKHKNRCRHQLVERYQTSTPRVVLGQVQIWGEVIESGQIFGDMLGYRSQQAYPNKLWVTCNEFGDEAEAVAASLSELYQVEAHVIDEAASLVFYGEGDSERLPSNVPT